MWSGLRPTYSLNSFMLQGCSGKETRTRSLGPTRHDTRTSTYFSETATTTETDTAHSNQRNPIVARRNRQRTLPNVMLSTRSYRPSANTFPAIAPRSVRARETATQLTMPNDSRRSNIHCFTLGGCCAPLHRLDWSCGRSTRMFSAT